MSKTNMESIYSKIDSFPTLPATVSRVLEITGNPESSAHELMQAILPDQAMCTTILKVANSAFFGLPREVSTMEKAVMVLGFDEIRNVILGKAVLNTFKQLNGDNRKSIEAFWQHSFSCGLAAKILAERIGVSPSEMFIAGLIHDVGKLAMLMTFPNIYAHFLKVSDTTQLQSWEKERELFFICHDEVAYKILDRWFFPKGLLVAVGYHHHPREAAATNLLPSLIQIADILSIVHHNSRNMSALDYRAIMLNICPDVFDLWQEMGLACKDEDVKIWFQLLRESHEKDNAILRIFSA